MFDLSFELGSISDVVSMFFSFIVGILWYVIFGMEDF